MTTNVIKYDDCSTCEGEGLVVVGWGEQCPTCSWRARAEAAEAEVTVLRFVEQTVTKATKLSTWSHALWLAGVLSMAAVITCALVVCDTSIPQRVIGAACVVVLALAAIAPLLSERKRR